MGRPRYAPAQRCEWLVEPLGAESIEAWLVAVELEDGHDFLKERPRRTGCAALRCLCAVSPYSCPVLARDLTPAGATAAPGLRGDWPRHSFPEAASFIPRCRAPPPCIVQGARVSDSSHAGVRRRGGASRPAAAVGDGLGDAGGARAQHRTAAAGRVHERRGSVGVPAACPFGTRRSAAEDARAASGRRRWTRRWSKGTAPLCDIAALGSAAPPSPSPPPTVPIPHVCHPTADSYAWLVPPVHVACPWPLTHTIRTFTTDADFPATEPQD